MREDGPDDRPLGDTADGPPSARARDDLRADLRREVADARLRLEEAGLRAETHRLLGDDRAAAEAIAEQQQVVADLEHRLGRVVSSAVLQRDAEEVLAGVTTGPVAEPPAPAAPDDVSPARRVPALSGVASAVAVLAVAVLAVVGVTDEPSRLDALGAADSAQTEQPAATETERPSPRSVPPADPTGRDDPAPESERAPAPAATGTGSDTTATSEPTSPPTPEGDPTELPTDPSLDELVAGLTDALRQLGDETTLREEIAEREGPDAEQAPTDDEETRGPLDGRTESPSEDDAEWFAPSGTDEPTRASTEESTTPDEDVDDGFVSDSAAQ